MSSTLLEVEEVTKQFAAAQALAGLSFRVETGQIFALLGPNGAGKTTMVRLLMNIIRPDSGRVRYHLPGSSDGRARPIDLGYLPEDRGLYQDQPVLRTLVYMGALRGMEREQARQAALAWLERLGLAERAGDKLETLSKGNQQRVQFIAAVLHRPAFAVLDEAFSGLDPLNQQEMLGIIRELRDAGTTVLFSAHQMSLVERLADHVLLIHRGRRVAAGTVEELRQSARGEGRIVLELGEPPDLASVAAMPAVLSAELLPGGELSVLLGKNGSLNGFLTAVSGRYEIRRLRSTEIDLHDIFVGAISAAGDAAPQEEEV